MCTEPNATEREAARATFGECYWGAEAGRCIERLRCSSCDATEKAAQLLAAQRAAHEWELATVEAERDAWKQSYEDACAIADRISADVAAAEAEIGRLRRDLGVDQ